MKILQCNVWGGKLGYSLVETLKSEDADVVCMQEAISRHDGDIFYFESVEQILEKTNYEYLDFLPTFEFDVFNVKARQGLAVLSKHPIEKSEHQYFRGDFKQDFNPMVDDYNIQGFQKIEVSINGVTYNILNYHGYHVPGHKNGNDETMRQCGKIAEYSENLQRETILTGDFNLNPTSESIKLVEKVLDNSIAKTGHKTTRNFLTPKSEVCDYIFTSKDLQVSNFKVLDDIISDHSALVAEVD